MKRIWKAKPQAAGDLLSQLLANRGLFAPEEIRDFLDPRYEAAHDPFLLRDMDRAVARIETALQKGEKITIYADYDADAVTAAAVLLRFFQELKHRNVSAYIPDRFSEGYGVNPEAIRSLKESGTNLIITVDCGINAFDAVDLATYLGLDVIVTDHHQLTGGVPRACAVIDPHRPDDNYPFKDLTGVGVAFKLVQGLLQSSGLQATSYKLQAGWEKWLLDLVAIGTVADCQSVLGENRMFIKWGLVVLSKTRWIGLGKLLELAGIAGAELDTYKIGFMIAPRINAAGRIEHANLALEFLLTDNPERAAILAQKLEELNRHRQDLTEQILSEAREQLLALGDKKILLAAGRGWPRGIVGLVAGKLTEEFYRPVLVLARGEVEATGSARSIRNFNIIEAISQSKELLLKYGGHPMAAGFTLNSEQVEIFHQQLLLYAEKTLSEEDLSPVIYYDAELTLKEINEEFLATLLKFAPFGQGNPRPLFRVNHLALESASAIGTEGKHLRLYVKEGGRRLGCIGFNLGFWAEKLQRRPQSIDLLCEPQYNEWNGTRQIQLKIIDLDFSKNSRVE